MNKKTVSIHAKLIVTYTIINLLTFFVFLCGISATNQMRKIAGNEQVTQYFYTYRTVGIVVIILAVGFILTTTISITRGIRINMTAIIQSAEKLSKGDVNVDIMVKSDDEFGQLSEALLTIRDSMKSDSILLSIHYLKYLI